MQKSEVFEKFPPITPGKFIRKGPWEFGVWAQEPRPWYSNGAVLVFRPCPKRIPKKLVRFIENPDKETPGLAHILKFESEAEPAELGGFWRKNRVLVESKGWKCFVTGEWLAYALAAVNEGETPNLALAVVQPTGTNVFGEPLKLERGFLYIYDSEGLRAILPVFVLERKQ